MDDLTTDEQLMVRLGNVLNEFQAKKPNDRSEKDRRYAVTITELEKAIAWFYLWVVKGDSLPRGD